MAPPSYGDVAIPLRLLVRFVSAIIFTFSLVSCLGYLGNIVVWAVDGLMILLTGHNATIGAFIPIQKGGIITERWRKICARQVAEMPRLHMFT